MTHWNIYFSSCYFICCWMLREILNKILRYNYVPGLKPKQAMDYIERLYWVWDKHRTIWTYRSSLLRQPLECSQKIVSLSKLYFRFGTHIHTFSQNALPWVRHAATKFNQISWTQEGKHEKTQRQPRQEDNTYLLALFVCSVWLLSSCPLDDGLL